MFKAVCPPTMAFEWSEAKALGGRFVPRCPEVGNTTTKERGISAMKEASEDSATTCVQQRLVREGS